MWSQLTSFTFTWGLGIELTRLGLYKCPYLLSHLAAPSILDFSSSDLQISFPLPFLSSFLLKSSQPDLFRFSDKSQDDLKNIYQVYSTSTDKPECQLSTVKGGPHLTANDQKSKDATSREYTVPSL